MSLCTAMVINQLLGLTAFTNRTNYPFLLKDGPVLLFLQHSNMAMRNYVLNGTFVFLLSPPANNAFQAVNQKWSEQREEGDKLLWCFSQVVWVINAAQTPVNKFPEGEREKERLQITGTHPHIYNYNERSWRVSPEDMDGSTKGPHTQSMHTHIHTYAVCSL